MSYLKYPPIEATSIADGTIVNADVDAAAAIALSKLAATTASRALVSDASGFVSAATTTATEIGYVNGVTSAIQTQLGTKVTSGGALGTPASGTLTNCTGLPQTGIGATVYVRADNPTSTVTGSLTDITTWSEVTDTNTAFNPTTGVFTVPSTGIYSISLRVLNNATIALGDFIQIDCLVNGSAVYSGYFVGAGATGSIGTNLHVDLALTASNTVKFQIQNTATTPTWTGGAQYNFLTITKIGN